MRAHKITFQAMWSILLPGMTTFFVQNYDALKQKIDIAKQEMDDTSLITLYVSSEFQDAMDKFIESKNMNFNFLWWFE